MVANDGESELADRRIRFYGDLVVYPFKAPRNPKDWIGEAGTADVASSDSIDVRSDWAGETLHDYDFLSLAETVIFLGPGVGDVSQHPRPGFEWRAWRENSKWHLVFDGDPENPALPARTIASHSAARLWRKIFTTAQLVADQRVAKIKKHFIRLACSREPLSPVTSGQDFQLSSEGQVNSSSLPAVKDLETVLSALACRRQGINETEMRNLVERVLQVRNPRAQWEILRAWEEIGYFDRLLNLRWQDRRYFAKVPRLALYKVATEFRATLYGLCADSVRRRLLLEAGRLSIESQEGTSISPYVPSLVGFSSLSLDQLLDLSSRCDLAPPTWIRPPEGCIAPLSSIFRSPRPPPPLNYDLMGRWDAHSLRFRSNGPRDSVSLEWYWRSDAPTYFVLLKEERMIWWSYSRNWALLLEQQLNQHLAFESFGSRTLNRRVDAAAHLPIPTARLISLLSLVSPGPTTESGTSVYSYVFPTQKMRNEVIANLYFDAT